MSDPSPEQLAGNRKLLLRGFVLLGAIAGTVFYIGIWHWLWQIPNNRRDGFELIAPFLGTIYFVLFVVPAWYFGIKNYALWIGAICSAIALVIATDTVRPWFPWHIFGGS
jgi:hypothetical protein